MPKSKKTTEARFWEKIEKGANCWIWRGARDKFGYGRFWYKSDSERRLLGAHRMMWELVKGPIPNDLHVLHACDNPTCVNPNHLFLGKHIDNMRDMLQKKRRVHKVGQQLPQTKLSDADVRGILYARQQGMSQADVAQIYHVSQAYISMLERRLRRRNLTTQNK